MALENSDFRKINIGRFGPPQGIVRFAANESKELNLTTDFPTKAQLTAAIAHVLGNFSNGFRTLRGSQLTDHFWYYGGLDGWYVSSLLPGFDTCSTGPFRGDAYYKCTLRDLHGLESAKGMHSRMSDAISSTKGSKFPDLGSAEIAQCSSEKLFLGYRCVQATEWISHNLTPYVRLSMNGFKDDYYIELVVISLGTGTQ